MVGVKGTTEWPCLPRDSGSRVWARRLLHNDDKQASSLLCPAGRGGRAHLAGHADTGPKTG